MPLKIILEMKIELSFWSKKKHKLIANERVSNQNPRKTSTCLSKFPKNSSVNVAHMISAIELIP